MAFVVDASIVICCAFDDEDDPIADFAFDQLCTSHAVGPALWWCEVPNTLLVNERRGRITPDASVLTLARSHRLTVYDAAYLELARRTELPIATLDKAIMRGARAEGVELAA